MKYPNECCRCGFCCIAELCPVAKKLFPLANRCPMLTFDNGVATCGLAGLLVPTGDGCCLKARAFRNGQVYDFAALPIELKRRAVSDKLQSMEG